MLSCYISERSNTMSNQVNILHVKDNVATAIVKIPKDEDFRIKMDDEFYSLSTIEDIPLGHKVALKDLPQGSEIIKYGEVIGVATKDILCGELVHIHNVESLRGRGDLAKEENK